MRYFPELTLPIIRRSLCLTLSCSGFFSAACSVKIPHDDGSVTYLGMVRINESSAANKAVVNHVRRLGVGVDAGIKKGGVLIGYQDRLLISPLDDAITEIDYRSAGRSYLGKIEKVD